MQSLRKGTLKALVGLALSLLIVAPFVVGALHDDHDGDRCLICKVDGQSATPTGPALVLANPHSRQLSFEAVRLTPPRAGHDLTAAPRGPPA